MLRSMIFDYQYSEKHCNSKAIKMAVLSSFRTLGYFISTLTADSLPIVLSNRLCTFLCKYLYPIMKIKTKAIDSGNLKLLYGNFQQFRQHQCKENRMNVPIHDFSNILFYFISSDNLVGTFVTYTCRKCRDQR